MRFFIQRLLLFLFIASSVWAGEQKTADSDELAHLLEATNDDLSPRGANQRRASEPFAMMLSQFADGKTRRFADEFFASMPEEKRAALFAQAQALQQDRAANRRKIISAGQLAQQSLPTSQDIAAFTEQLLAHFSDRHEQQQREHQAHIINAKKKSKRKNTCSMITTFALTIAATGAGSLTKTWCSAS